jgi:spore maturation protein CgeB
MGATGDEAMQLGAARNAIIAGDFWHGASERAVAQGLRELGWNVHEAAASDHFLVTRSLPLRAINRVIENLSIRSYNEAIENLARALHVECLLFFKGSHIDPAMVARAKNEGRITALFYPDVYFEGHKTDPKLLDEVDLLFTTKSYHREYLDGLRGPGRWHLIQHGFSPLVHRPHYAQVEEARFLYDIAYVGNPDASKAALLIEVARRFPDRKMIVAGDRWDRFAAGTPLEGRTTKERVTGDFMAEIVQRSRINIASHATPAGPQGWRDSVSTRTFEIPACKGFMLHEDNAEVRELYDPEAEIAVFSTVEDLCEKIAHFLKNPAARRAISEAGYRRAVPAYSYYQRAGEVAAAITNCRGGEVKADVPAARINATVRS